MPAATQSQHAPRTSQSHASQAHFEAAACHIKDRKRKTLRVAAAPGARHRATSWSGYLLVGVGGSTAVRIHSTGAAMHACGQAGARLEGAEVTVVDAEDVAVEATAAQHARELRLRVHLD